MRRLMARITLATYVMLVTLAGPAFCCTTPRLAGGLTRAEGNSAGRRRDLTGAVITFHPRAAERHAR
jgi:hypothetical protein